MKILRYRLTSYLFIIFMLLLTACGGSGGDNQPGSSMTWDESQWNEANWQ